jgi:hypothetical protein
VTANRDALRPDVRRYLLKRLGELAHKRRAEAEKAIKKAKHVEEMVDRLAEVRTRCLSEKPSHLLALPNIP